MSTFKNTAELAHGDMIANDMMRLLIDGPLNNNQNNRNWSSDTVYWTSAVIANAAYLRDEAARGNDHARFIVGLADKDANEPEVLRWTIQGNTRAIWRVMSEFEVAQARDDEAERMARPQPQPEPETDPQMIAAAAIEPPTRNQGRSDARQDFLRDVFTIGLEGGIGYWSAAARYRHSDLDTFHAVIVPSGEHDVDGVSAWGIWDDDDERETAPLRIDADVIARGLRLYRLWAHGQIDFQGNEKPRGEWRKTPHSQCVGVLQADQTNYREGDIDADDADSIIQFGLFGAMIFG